MLLFEDENERKKYSRRYLDDFVLLLIFLRLSSNSFLHELLQTYLELLGSKFPYSSNDLLFCTPVEKEFQKPKCAA